MKKKYVQIELGRRARFFYEAIASTCYQIHELIGFCDVFQTGMDYANRILVNKYGQKKVKIYMPSRFEQLLNDVRLAEVIITSIGRMHHGYIIHAMKEEYDVIYEKPLTINEEKAQEIITVQKQTERDPQVTFNYRYAPYHTKTKELIESDVIGDMSSIHPEWLLNMQHGVDYLRRWHQNKYSSDGLPVHKSTHHFDLVNFWLNSRPQRVFAFGGLDSYGAHNAEKHGVEIFCSRYYENELAKADLFAIDLSANEGLREMYLEAEKDSGYIRDRSVFSNGISIGDTLGVTIRYEIGTILTYLLNAYIPWEGFNVSFNGNKGWIEMKVIERSYVDVGGDKRDEGAAVLQSIHVYPIFGEPCEVITEQEAGEHGREGPRLLDDLFGEEREENPQNQAATHVDGILSILTGIVADHSITSGKAIVIDELVSLKE